jgi:4-hydroxy-L-threonine phosphate dehydrogenase PdxA
MRPCGHEMYNEGCPTCEELRAEFLRSTHEALKEIWTESTQEHINDMIRIFGREMAEKMVQEAFSESMSKESLGR